MVYCRPDAYIVDLSQLSDVAKHNCHSFHSFSFVLNDELPPNWLQLAAIN